MRGSKTSQFQYPSRLDGNSIRLLKIVAGSSDDDLATLDIQLERYNLDNVPYFHALSYTWGPPKREDRAYTKEDMVDVLVNGDGFSIFPNLADALHRLLELGHAEHYWVDALCINQDDTDEREVQVGMMDRIFKAANRIDIWIGESDDSHAGAVAQVMETMSKLLDDEIDRLDKGGRAWQVLDLASGPFLESYGLPNMNNEIWHSFIDFFERTWFRRVWILQEVALAREAVVLWDEHIISWETVSNCVTFLSLTNMALGLAELSRTSESVGQAERIASSCISIGLVKWLCDDPRYILRTGLSVRLLDDMQRNEVTVADAFLTLLLASRFQGSTDKRDKIFSLIGITNHVSDLMMLPQQTSLSPDYKSTTAKIFTAATTWIVQECNHIGILTLVSDASMISVPELPSWVPDFSVSSPEPIHNQIQAPEAAPFNATASSRLNINDQSTIHVDGGHLHLQATVIDSIAATSDLLPQMLNQGGIESYSRLICRLPKTYAPTGQSRVEAFWRTMIYDSDYSQRPAKAELRHSFRAVITFVISRAFHNVTGIRRIWFPRDRYLAGLRHTWLLAAEDETGALPDLQSIRRFLVANNMISPDTQDDLDSLDPTTLSIQVLEEMQAYYCIISGTSVERRLYVTYRGYLGLGPKSIKPGDSVCLARGCVTPLILRRSHIPAGGYMITIIKTMTSWIYWLRDIILRRCASLFGWSHILSSSAPVSNPPYDDRPSLYRLVGETYVHGIMNGEAVTEDTGWKDIILE
jgi:hypothetical protein